MSRGNVYCSDLTLKNPFLRLKTIVNFIMREKSICLFITFLTLVFILPTHVIAEKFLNSANNYGEVKSQIKLIAMSSSNEVSSMNADTEEKNEYTPIAEIWNDPEKYLNQTVTLRGQYQGWHGEGIKHPLITRSDWVIKDNTGAIYVTGRTGIRLRPERDIGVEIIVRGKVLLNKENVPYIKAIEVTKIKSERRIQHEKENIFCCD